MAVVELCQCEVVSHGALGPVGDTERLARLVTSPNHFRRNGGGLKPGAFPLSHIKDSGVSLLRVDLMSEENITEISRKIAGLKEGEQPKGLLITTAKDLRGLKDEDENRLLCVIDDPVLNSPPAPDNPAHAIAVSSKTRADDEILEIQAVLLRMFDRGITELGAVHTSASE